MKHKPNIIGACLAVAVAMAGLSASPASAATFKADCDKGQSIQHKLDIAKNGDTVEVSGTCTESVVLRTDWVTLICVDGASITGEASAAPATTTVSVLASNATIEDCAISGPASNGNGDRRLRKRLRDADRQ